MKERFFGEDKDREATRQLGLSGDWSIFMMGCEVDYIDDIHAIAQQFNEDGYSCLVSPEEVVDAVQDAVVAVKLPTGFVLVGVAPFGQDEPRQYGVVDFSRFRHEGHDHG